MPERFNIAPTNRAAIVHQVDGGQVLARMAFGLIPSWSREPKSGFATFNARVETASTKPAFRSAWRARHAAVPMTGYFEWVGEGKAKQPWFLSAPDGEPIWAAAIWEHWEREGADPIDTFAVLTEPAMGVAKDVHDRMPVLLTPDLVPDWLSTGAQDGAALLQARQAPALRVHPVSRDVGNVRNDGPALIEAAWPS